MCSAIHAGIYTEPVSGYEKNGGKHRVKHSVGPTLNKFLSHTNLEFHFL